MYLGNVSPMFIYFAGKVSDEKTVKVSTRVNYLQYIWWMSILVMWLVRRFLDTEVDGLSLCISMLCL